MFYFMGSRRANWKGWLVAGLRKIADWVLNREIPHIDDKWGGLERVFLVGFIVLFSIAFVQYYPGVFLGFGLGDEYVWDMIVGFYAKLKAENSVLFYSGLGLLIFNVLFRMQVFLRGQLAYKSNAPELPMRSIALMMGTGLVNAVFVFVSVVLLGVSAWLLGFDFDVGFHAVQRQVHAALYVANGLPTLIELPLFMAFVVVYLLQGFVHYWIHRLCHLNRFMWLVLHRIHHMPPTLTLATTPVVISSVPFFIVMVFVKTLIFAAISKLFYARPLFMEIFFYHLVIWIPEAYAHQSALYVEGIRKRWNLFLANMMGGGVYHLLHHSNEEWVVRKNKSNQVNISGGIFFFWDRVFGTYLPVDPKACKAPRVGLWGNPSLHHNPLRLVLSGLLQVIYELRQNKGIKTKVMCLLGSVNYTPPISRDYHVSEAVTAEVDTMGEEVGRDRGGL